MVKRGVRPEEWYALGQLVEREVFPWLGKDIRRYRRVVMADKLSGNALKAIVSGTGRARRYRIKGEHVIRFQKLAELGKVPIN